MILSSGTWALSRTPAGLLRFETDLPIDLLGVFARSAPASPPPPSGFNPPPDFELKLKPGKPFTMRWPNKDEEYVRVREGTLHVRGKDYDVVVGHPKIKRASCGRDRDRVTVWLNKYPTIEVVEGDDGKAASLIRSKHDRGNANSIANVPDDYRAWGFSLDKFNSSVKGPRAWNSISVIDKLDNAEIWVAHAYLRHVARKQRP